MKVNLDDALNQLDKYGVHLFVKVMAHVTMSVELFRPAKVDLNSPHLQDELYVVISGTGEFLNNGILSIFRPPSPAPVPANH